MAKEKSIFNNWNREPKILAQIYEFYISGTIGEPECYVDTFDIIRHARSDDIIKLYINSYGGSLFTGIQFLRVLSETEASVIVSIEGAAMSAATLLFLAADSVEITPNSSILIHDYSSGTFGKGGEMYNQLVHERKWSDNLFRQVYKDFLTPEEITSVLEGRDIWLSSEDTLLRLEKRANVSKELAESLAEASTEDTEQLAESE